MKLLPEKKPKVQQKVAVADQTGVLQCFSLKKGETVVGLKLALYCFVSVFLSLLFYHLSHSYQNTNGTIK